MTDYQLARDILEIHQKLDALAQRQEMLLQLLTQPPEDKAEKQTR